MILTLFAWMTSARAGDNSKRPADQSPTSLMSNRALSAATHVAKAATVIGQVAHMTASAMDKEMVKAAQKVAKVSGDTLGNGLARLTAYWCSEGDYNTRHRISATGIRLHSGHCAVDPSVIPYGSVVKIDGLGTYLAVDTGTAVVSRKAARKSGHSRTERHALVIDLFFEDRQDGERFAAQGPKFATITWWSPQAYAASMPAASDLIAYNDTAHGRSL